MRKGTLYVSFYRNNRIFDILDEEANRDDGRRFYYDLRQNFLANGFDLSTQDLNPGEQSEFVIYHDMPKPRHLESPGKSYLLLMEPPTVKPRGWAPKNHKYFKRIFTYHDAFVNTDTNTSGKYVKVNYAQNFSFEPTFEIGQRPKLCATIVGNKTSTCGSMWRSGFKTTTPTSLTFTGRVGRDSNSRSLGFSPRFSRRERR
jgi:hypothetical protein